MKSKKKKNNVKGTSNSTCTSTTHNQKKTPLSSKSSSTPPTLPPSLLFHKDNKNRSKNNVLQTLVPSAVFVSRNFLSTSECKAWVDHAEQTIGFEHMNNPQTREYAHRECGRIQINDWNMAELLYQRMKPLVEDIAKQVALVIGSNGGNDRHHYQPVCCNGNIRIYKYEKNMSFGRHFDGSNSIPRFQNGNTEITVLIYLSSCEGGATRFYLPAPPSSSSSRKKKAKKQKNVNETSLTSSNSPNGNGYKDGIAFVPEAGAILMHMHGDRCLEHEADPVLRGVKYVLRTDIVYGTTE